jgi:hypothetical protein
LSNASPIEKDFSDFLHDFYEMMQRCLIISSHDNYK